MNDETRRDEESQEEQALVARYEEMNRLNTSWYFDIDQFEQIISFYFDQGRTKSALQAVRYAENIFPNSPTLLLREAQVMAANGELSRAIPRLKNLLHLEPNNDEIHLTLASIYSQSRKHEKAIKHFSIALKLCSDDFRDDITLDLALEYESSNQYHLAIELLKKTITRNPKHETATFELAFCYEMADKPHQAIEFFNTFIDQSPYSFAAWYSLGNAYGKIEKYEKAVSALEYCLAIREDFAQGWISLANCLVQKSEYQKAIDAFNEAIKLEKPDAAILCYLGECYEKLEQPEEALKYYEQSIENNELYADAYIGKSVVLDILGKSKQALVFMESAHKIESENEDIQLMLAELYSKMKRRDQAEVLYKALVKNHPKLVEVWLDYAHFLYGNDEISEASKLTEEALGEIPDNGSLLFRKVAYLHAKGKVKEAMLLLGFLFDSGFTESVELIEYYPDILNEPVALDLYNSAKA